MKGKKVEKYDFDRMMKDGHRKQQAVMATLIEKTKKTKGKGRHSGGKFPEARYD